MCWYSAEHFGQELLQAEAGQRLGVRKMHWDATRWVVRECDVQQTRPAPVCLLDGTRVLFRPTEAQQASLATGPEPEAVFHQLQRPKRDVFEFEGGRQIEVNHLPDGLTLDVLVVPGKERLSTLVTMEGNSEPASEVAQEEESVLAPLARMW